MATTYLTRTSGTPTNALKWTYSFWVKISSLSTSDDTFLLDFNTDGNNRSNIGFNGSQQLVVYEKVSGSTSQLFTSNRLFRDNSGWYNIVVSCDRTLATAGDRTKIYINGVQETSWASQTNPAQNTTGIINTAVNTLIGKYSQSGVYFNGLLSHVHFVDGTAYDASNFGSTDSTTGEWEINTIPTLTYGNNGFFILKDGNSVNDQSGNANNFTVGGGTLTNTEDCPSNVFATFNPVIRTYGSFSQGSNTFTDSTNNFQTGFSSIGMDNGQGKYYAEFKVVSGANVYFGIADYKTSGVIDRNQRGENSYLGQYSNSYGYQMGGTFYYNGSSTGTGYDAYTTSNVIGVAVDMDNLKIYFHKDGVYQGSANPASNNGFTIVAPEGAYCMATAVANSVVNANFGNGYFGTTAISSEGTNASGIGKFEYDVPAGYTALSTKGLNE
jgi:hypothetical protein